MGGKAKPTKHTAKEIAMKHHESKMKKGGRGGGQDGIEKRNAPKEGKRNIFIKCEKCFLMQPSLKSMEIHYESKHPKESWADALKIYNKQEEDQNQNQAQEDNDYEDEDNGEEVNEEEEKEKDH
jgi:hypothetical protein